MTSYTTKRMTVQLVARVDETLLDGVDALINLGVAGTRSEIVRIALCELIERTNQAEVDRRLVAAYSALPQSTDEVEQAHRAMLQMIAEEPW